MSNSISNEALNAYNKFIDNFNVNGKCVFNEEQSIVLLNCFANDLPVEKINNIAMLNPVTNEPIFSAAIMQEIFQGYRDGLADELVATFFEIGDNYEPVHTADEIKEFRELCVVAFNYTITEEAGTVLRDMYDKGCAYEEMTEYILNNCQPKPREKSLAELVAEAYEKSDAHNSGLGQNKQDIDFSIG